MVLTAFFILIFALIGGGAVIYATNKDEKAVCEFGGGMATTGFMLGFIVAFVGMFFWFVLGSNNANSKANSAEYTRNFEILDDRKGDLEDVIRAELDGYQDFEFGVIDSIDASIVLRFPELTTNEVLLAKVDDLVELREELYDLQLACSSYVTDLENNNNGFWMPTFLLGGYTTPVCDLPEN